MYFLKEKKSKKIKKKPKDQQKDLSKYIPLYEIIKSTKNDQSTKEMTDVIITITISFYRPGKFKLPVLDIFDSKNVKIGYKVPVVIIEATNKDGKQVVNELPLQFGGNYSRIVWLLMAVICLSVIATLIIIKIKKIRNRKIDEIVTIPAIDIFHDEMSNLKSKRYIEENNIEDYMFMISIIFRRFLSSQMKFDASEMTSEEIELKLKSVFSKYKYNKYGSEIIAIFYLWDLSKFAEFSPSTEVLMQKFTDTIEIADKIAEDYKYDII